MLRKIVAISLLAVLSGVACAADVDKNAAAVEKEIAESLGKLSAADRKLADAQRYCPIMTQVKLGEMGPPIKLTIKGQSVFLCCGGCRKAAEKDPDKTLAKLEELKAKKKAGEKHK